VLHVGVWVKNEVTPLNCDVYSYPRNQTLISASRDVRFSNRPFGVKRFQTIHHCSVDVARGLVLLFGIGTKALPLWDSRTSPDEVFGTHNAPFHRAIERLGAITSYPVLGGLHHEYCRI
jgi:hypothetical protein